MTKTMMKKKFWALFTVLISLAAIVTISPQAPAQAFSGRVSPCFNYGDINDDGYITQDDGLLVANYVSYTGAYGYTLTDEQKRRADVSGNGVVNLGDAMTIRNYASCESLSTFKVCSPTSASVSTKILAVLEQEALPEQISNLTCDAEKSCPQGLECVSFPEIGRRCVQPNPCSYYKCPENTRCLIAESYPPQVICSPVGPPSPGAEETVEHAINLDENIQASDFGIGEPKILPDNPFYFLKNWGRGIQSFFTFNPVAKSELKEKFANEKLLELKKTIEQKKNAEKIKKAAENYQQEAERVKEQVKKIKEKAAENPKVESFLNKFIQQQTLHQKLLQKLETQVPAQAIEKIKEAREAHIEGFQGVILKLENRQDKITEKLDEVLQEQKGSEFKEFKNLEVLKNLEEKVPEEAKEAIQKAQENALKRLRGNLEKMPQEDQERFAKYTEKISGAKEKQLEILEDIKAGIKIMPEAPKPLQQLQEKLEKGRSLILEKIGEEGRQMGCPTWNKPITTDFCKEGRVVFGPEIKGCLSQPLCVIPGDTPIGDGTGEAGTGEVPPVPPATGATPVPPATCETFITCEKGYEPYDTGERNKQGCPIKKCMKAVTGATPVPLSTGVGRACFQLWDPVCGKDGKTYSNECFTKIAGVEIDYKGICKEKETIKCTTNNDCPRTECIFGQPCQYYECVDRVCILRIQQPKPDACIQIISPAISPDGICKEFPTPCDVPEGWKKVNKCPDKKPLL